MSDGLVFPERAARLVGAELRRRRRERGWSRGTMCARLVVATGQKISVQALATYELGTRGLSVSRLAALCYTLGASLAELWSIVEDKLSGGGDAPPRVVTVDLRTVATSTRADLAPARAWARTQLEVDDPPTTAAKVLTLPALTSLATLCGLDVPDMATALSHNEDHDEDRDDEGGSVATRCPGPPLV